jgi:TfoX/Sxy family transcriptional regulator of competence genes
MTLQERLRQKLEPLGATGKRMFSGVGFMLNGNLVIGTMKDGLIVRVGEAQYADAIKRPGAKPFTMGDRVSKGWVTVDESAVSDDPALQQWVDVALAFVRTLPPKPETKTSARKKPARRKSR